MSIREEIAAAVVDARDVAMGFGAAHPGWDIIFSAEGYLAGNPIWPSTITEQELLIELRSITMPPTVGMITGKDLEALIDKMNSDDRLGELMGMPGVKIGLVKPAKH